MDKKDEQILEALHEDSSLTTRQITKKTLIPITTIHNRIKRMRSDGIIRKYTIEIDHKKLGKRFTALILITCDYKVLREQKRDQHDLVKEMLKLPEVENTEIVTGATDIVVRVRTTDVEEFDKFLFGKLQVIPGVEKTQSLVVISEQ